MHFLWRQQYAKETSVLITCSRKCCPTCKHLSLSRKQALFHLQTSHPEEDNSQITFPRINLHRETICAKCKTFHAYNLIKLSYSNEMHEVYLLGRINCNEIETPDHVWEYQFHIRCPFCNYIHRVDSEAAAFLYEYVNSHYQSQMLRGSR